jgi:glutamate/tyrosine decarboxylase-like PLP-dependent enzyme
MLHGEAVSEHHRGEEVCGVVTFGGTESLINPMLAYRDRGRAEKGITEPEVILPVTAHVALDKAAHLLGIKLLKAPLTDRWVADVEWIRDHVTANTVAGRLGGDLAPG